MLKKPLLAFSTIIFFLFNTVSTKADLKNPTNSILPAEVIKIQLVGLMNNDKKFKDSGIEQTWKFAHPNNQKYTGPLEKFKIMLKGESYNMLLNHLDHTIVAVQVGNGFADYEVTVLDIEKKYYKSINNLDSKLDLKKNSLLKLDSDTDNIIEYIDEKENKEKKLSFWDLIKNED